MSQENRQVSHENQPTPATATTDATGEVMSWEEAQDFGYFEETANTLEEVEAAAEGVDEYGNAR